MPLMVNEQVSVDYDVHGDGGPPLLMINGLGFGRWGFFKQVPALSRRFRVVTFDVRNAQNLSHGVADLSSAAVALLDHLGIRKAHVLGTSLGGFVAQELVLDRPDIVDRLVLVCTSYGGSGPQKMSPPALGAMLGLGALAPEDAARRGLEVATSDAYRAEKPEEFEEIVRWRITDSPSLAAYSQQLMAGARFDGSRGAGDIYAPTLVIHGREDCFVPVVNAAALADALPDATLRVLDDAGHLVFIEKAAQVNRYVSGFLKPRKPRKSPAKPDGRTSRLARAVRSLTGKLLGGFTR
jgi:pimeloyl-ACP methyl ester carboxylesterase